MAQLWKLTCIYIVDNNQYGMGTSLARAMSERDISKKGCAYEIASEFVDGMDVLAVREAVVSAVERGAKSRCPRCSKCAHTGSWATRCLTRATIARVLRSRSIRSAIRSSCSPRVCSNKRSSTTKDFRRSTKKCATK